MKEKMYIIFSILVIVSHENFDVFLYDGREKNDKSVKYSGRWQLRKNRIWSKVPASRWKDVKFDKRQQQILLGRGTRWGHTALFFVRVKYVSASTCLLRLTAHAAKLFVLFNETALCIMIYLMTIRFN